LQALPFWDDKRRNWNASLLRFGSDKFSEFPSFHALIVDLEPFLTVPSVVASHVDMDAVIKLCIPTIFIAPELWEKGKIKKKNQLKANLRNQHVP
jgi:hypothetical protein